jgi:hypothetical protein
MKLQLDTNAKTIKIEEDMLHEFYVIDKQGEFKDHFGRSFKNLSFRAVFLTFAFSLYKPS